MEGPFGKIYLPNVSLIVMISYVMLVSWLCIGFWNRLFFVPYLLHEYRIKYSLSGKDFTGLKMIQAFLSSLKCGSF